MIADLRALWIVPWFIFLFLIGVIVFLLFKSEHSKCKRWTDVSDYTATTLFGGKQYGMIQKCQDTGEYRNQIIVQ